MTDAMLHAYLHVTTEKRLQMHFSFTSDAHLAYLRSQNLHRRVVFKQ